MKKSIACIICNKGKVLIAHRNPTGQMGSRWEFPGGKVDDGETEQEAIRREMREEFDVDVTVHEKITEGKFCHNGKDFALEAYRVSVSHDGIEKKYKLTEHTEYKWVDINEILSENFVDSDLMIYPDVKKYLAKEK